ncbi:hypothetical protein [Mesorhizobium sp.]|uniref:hypothetical protein n=1 Tax=Mesorhizobium sp. TaxID=1871066 RepID=UPI000FE3A40B|nr:hypothetical protein [Mesorhizobium sp.]RWN51508.1 MAG: hypothetical protein EOR98_26235 [Mesorhizobium sp.]RWN72171.1 MAG: hypothetical protein EOS02_28155 [Mesorhizobium sp.]RWN73392.1 MAG: hypothetical protein EOS01_26300 [Mesorhizobium sp.]RWN85703.1 MAG: hypothetical protein EOS04_21595 [Mesorhizobium sp.]RWO09433.1 MAG: hypothetical protein EOS15_27130 [Mesorhizobium sp.]
MQSLGAKLVDKIADLILFGVIGLLTLLGNTLLGLQIFPDPFYHNGWIDGYRSWMLLFFMTFVISIAAGLWFRTLIILSVILVAGAVIFALCYGNSTSLPQSQQVAIWVLHWILYSLLPGFIAGWAVVVLKGLGIL